MHRIAFIFQQIESSRKALLISAVILFLTVRWLVVFQNNGLAFNIAAEELIYPTIAAERLRDNPLADEMMFQEYTTGGYVLESYLYMPLVALNSCSRHLLKIVPIAFSLLAFCFYLLIAYRWFSPRAALLFAVGFSLGPPLLLQFQIVGYANHNEVHVFLAPCLALTYYLLFDRPASLWRAGGAVFGLALLSALSVFYIYTALVFVVFVLALSPLIAWRLARMFRWRTLYLLLFILAGLIIGNIPFETVQKTIAHQYFGFYNSAGNSSELAYHAGTTALQMMVSSASWRFIGTAALNMYAFAARFWNWVFLLLLIVAVVVTGRAVVVWAGGVFRRIPAAIKQQQGLKLGIPLLLVLAYLLAFNYISRGEFSQVDEPDRAIYLPMAFHQLVVVMPFIYLLLSGTLAEWTLSRNVRVRLAGLIAVAVMVIGGLVAIGETTDFPMRGIGSRGCKDYHILTEATRLAVECNVPPEQVCETMDRYVLSFDPDHADAICEIMQRNTDCACPFQP